MAKEGDKIALAGQEVEVVKCKECELLMVNIDAKELKHGDLAILKRAGVRISNPETDEPICLKCDYESWGDRLNKWFDDDNDDDDDSSFFSPSSVGGLFGGSSFGSHSSGFGGFGGGGFGGGGASRSF